jgi:guanylate kinase
MDHPESSLNRIATDAPRRGKVFALSGPSAAGKSTLLKPLREQSDQFHFSVSATTRGPREGETDGKDYHFVSEEMFDAHIHNGDFLEHAGDYGNRYGTLHAPIEAALASGKDVLIDVNYAGVKALRKALPHDLVSVFVRPPHAREQDKPSYLEPGKHALSTAQIDEIVTILDKRIHERDGAKKDPAYFADRLGKAPQVLREAPYYDQVIVNSGTEAETQAVFHRLVEMYAAKRGPIHAVRDQGTIDPHARGQDIA